MGAIYQVQCARRVRLLDAEDMTRVTRWELFLLSTHPSACSHQDWGFPFEASLFALFGGKDVSSGVLPLQDLDVMTMKSWHVLAAG
jgi:hypothetical protein